MLRHRRLAVAALSLALVGLPACNGSDEDGGGGDTTTSTSVSTSTTQSTTTTTTVADGSTTTTAATGSAFRGTTSATSVPIPASTTGVALLRDVRVAAQDGFDRVVFEFIDQLPGYEIAYADGPIRQDGSGDVVDVEGDASLEVRFEPASGVDLGGETFRETYTGPARVRGDSKVVTEVVRAGDFEANLTWVIGADGKVPYRVDVLSNPSRVVIDVATS